MTAFEALQDRAMLSISPVLAQMQLPADASPLLAAALSQVHSATTFALAGGERQVAFDALGRVLVQSPASAESTQQAQGLQPLGLAPIGSATNATPLPTNSALVFQGQDNVNDTLSLDLGTLPRLADGSPQVKTIVYNGGAGGYDTLILKGGSFQSERYTPTGKDSGILTYDNFTVIFTGLEPIYDDSYASSITIDAEGLAGEVDILDGGQINGADALTVASNSFEELSFANKDTAVLNAGGDTVSLGYTRQATGLNRLELWDNGYSSNTTFVFHQPAVEEGTLGNVYIGATAATLDFSDFTHDLTIGLNTTDPQVVNSAGDLTLTLRNNNNNGPAVDTGIQYLIGGSGTNFFTAGPNSTLYGGSGNNTFAFQPIEYESNLVVADPNASSNTLDFSALSSSQPVTIDLTNDGLQGVCPDLLTLTLVSRNDNGDTGIDNVIGGAGNDAIFGNSRNNYLFGGAGDDSLSGGDGNDTLDGGAGNNTLSGGAGNDIIYTGDGNNSITLGDGDNQIYAGDGNNSITVGNGNNNINAGSGDNSITTGSGNNIINTGGGSNTITGGGYNLVNGQPTNHPPVFGEQDGSGGLVDLAGTNGTATVTWYVAASDQDQTTELAISVVSDSTDDNLPLSITETSFDHWTVTATVSEQDVQHTRKATLRVTDNGGLATNVNLYAVTRDSTAAEGNDLGPFNWPVVAYDNWLPVPEDRHLVADNGNYTVVPISIPSIDGLTYQPHVQFQIVDAPQHAQSFSFDTSNGSFDYVAADGFSGEDYFTYQVTDHVNDSTVQGVSDKGKITLGRPNLGVKEVLHNQDNGDLSDADKVSTNTHTAQGAFVPLHSDEYDVDTAGHSTLLHIVLKKFNPAPGEWAGFYGIGSFANLTLWTNPEKRGVPVAAGFFGADHDTNLWVEGVNGGPQNLRVYWNNLAHNNTDSSLVTVFSWEGPRDVPENSTYTYAAHGMPGTDSYWVDGGVGSIMIGQNLENPYPTTDKAQFKWDDGPIIGSAAYRAAPGFIWDMDVNVVKVDVGPPENGPIFQVAPGVPRNGGVNTFWAPYPTTSMLGITVYGNTAANGPDGHREGIAWFAKVTLTGPLGGRGIDKIKTGFIQTMSSVIMYGEYFDGGELHADLETKGGLNDAVIKPNLDTSPWYITDAQQPKAMFTGVRDPNDLAYKPPTYTKTIESWDAPSVDIPLTRSKETDLNKILRTTADRLKSVRIEETFRIDVTSLTTDATVDGEEVYTSMASANWTFNGNGDVFWEFDGQGNYVAATWLDDEGRYWHDDAWSTDRKGTPYPPRPWLNAYDATVHIHFQ